jgi:hypothetical protein
MRTLVFLAVLAICDVARADERADERIRLEGGLGVRWVDMILVNQDVDAGHQGHLDVGVRRDRWLVYGEYDLMQLTYKGPPIEVGERGTETVNGRGLLHRLGGNVRYTVGRIGNSHDGGLDLYGELGGGIEHFVWDIGGVLTRPDLAIGVGTQALALDDHQFGGISLGFRAVLARHDAHGALACGGPCDRATAPTGWDRSFMFDLTLLFGK